MCGITVFISETFAHVRRAQRLLSQRCLNEDAILNQTWSFHLYRRNLSLSLTFASGCRFKDEQYLPGISVSHNASSVGRIQQFQFLQHIFPGCLVKRHTNVFFTKVLYNSYKCVDPFLNTVVHYLLIIRNQQNMTTVVCDRFSAFRKKQYRRTFMLIDDNKVFFQRPNFFYCPIRIRTSLALTLIS